MSQPVPSVGLPEEVFQAELDTIRARREAAGLDTEALDAVEGNAPSVARGLVGLAISGGGIRSSTFSLGVIQALAGANPLQRDLFRRIDCVPTVSGGGYTGSMLSSLLRDPGDYDAGFRSRSRREARSRRRSSTCATGATTSTPGASSTRFEIDLERLRLDDDGLSASHFAVGTIHYGEAEEEKGIIVYVKSSFSGDESPYVRKYRADRPAFPHQTTADQFFDEVQFEAYRDLGLHVGSLVMMDETTRSIPEFGGAG